VILGGGEKSRRERCGGGGGGGYDPYVSRQAMSRSHLQTWVWDGQFSWQDF